MLGVMGNLMSCRLIGMETLRFSLAKIPSRCFDDPAIEFLLRREPIFGIHCPLPLI